MIMVALLGEAKDLKTLRVTTDPQMSCINCENKISFENLNAGSHIFS